ncbi:MAG: hypothetical protein KAT79_04445 [candidate division Zixibacteria bacterium]|nr:hypothetical protein [candidate division Zixibacteria bacterium]
MKTDTGRNRELDLVEQVDTLGDQVKTLALNMAIYLAKTKNDSEQISRLEPEFIRLVNGTVKVVQELAVIINAARNSEKMVWDVASGRIGHDMLEMKLRSILDQCSKIMSALGVEPPLSGRPE